MNKYMKEALKEAKKAYDKGEIPVGCVIVYQDKIIARGHNLRQSKQMIFTHAECIAIEKACKKRSTWRLEDCSLYVTLEPCSMCCGAIIQARIKNLYYGAKESKTGACGSVLNLFDYKFNHKVHVFEGILKEDCEKMIKDFFIKLRNNKKALETKVELC